MRFSHDRPSEDVVNTTQPPSPSPQLQSGSDPDLEAGSSDPGRHDEKNMDSDADPNIVSWDGPDDPENPLNWPPWKKGITILCTSLMAFYIPLASSMFAPGVSEVMLEFHSDNLELASFVVSVFVLGFAFGPVMLAPLSEIYGRRGLYCLCNILFLVFTVVSAKSNSLGMLTGFRFLAGFVGGMPLAVGGGTITDIMGMQYALKL
jgi:hypothetical protein